MSKLHALERNGRRWEAQLDAGGHSFTIRSGDTITRERFHSVELATKLLGHAVRKKQSAGYRPVRARDEDGPGVRVEDGLKVVPEASLTDESSFTLIYAHPKTAAAWRITLWSNIVTLFDSRTGWSETNVRFYKGDRPSAKQRAMAVAEFTKQIRAKLKAGYLLVSDSREPDPRPPARQVDRSKLTGAALIRYLGTRDPFKAHPEGAVALKQVRAIRRAAQQVLVKGDLTLERIKNEVPLLINGDLHVTGNLFHESVTLAITGDLVVDGVIDSLAEYTQLVVGGNITAKAINNWNGVSCGGTVTDAVHLMHGSGALEAKALVTRLLITDSYDLTLDANVRAKTRVDFTDDEDQAQATLRTVLMPALVKTRFSSAALMARMKRGTRIWAHGR